MRLVAKAKPVKIRIKSGGEEHVSLESLKHNFCVEDIRLLLDGRLTRWLKQRNEEALAKEIDNWDTFSLDTPKGYLDFIMLFFQNDLPSDSINTLLDLAQYWKNKTEYKKNSLILYQHLLNSEIEAAKKIYKEKILNNIDWHKTFLQFPDFEQDAEAMWLLGKLLFDKGEIEEGYRYIQKAAQKGSCKEAFMFVSEREYEKELEKKHRFYGVDKEAFTKFGNDLTLSWVNNFSGKNREVALFIYHCRLIIRDIYKNGSYYAIDRALELFHRNSSSCLRIEMEFIIGLIYDEYGSKKAKEQYLKIVDIYFPAQQMLTKTTFAINLRNRSLAQQITYIVQHLFEFE